MSRRRRILMFVPHFAEYALRLSTAAAAASEVLLVVDGDNLLGECRPEWIAEARRAGVRILAYRYRGTLSRALWFGRIMARIALFRPDLVHMQEQADGSSLRIVQRLVRRMPLLLTVHDPRPHSGADAANHVRHAAGFTRLRALATAFHVHGDFCRRELEAEAGGRAILSTQHGAILAPAAGERTAPEPGHVLMFGRMEAYKGVEAALAVAETLNARGVPMRLTLAGRGEELQRLAARIAACPGVTLMERYLSPADAVALFQRAALVILPYTDATQSGVVSAAVAAGRPVVAYAVGGLPDSVADGVTGLLAPGGDLPALTEATARLLQEPALSAALSRGVAAAASAGFAWETVVETLSPVYEGRAPAPGRGDAVAAKV